MRGKSAIVLVTIGLAAAYPAVSSAQLNQQKFQSEVRLDGIFARTGAVQAGYGFTVPSGIYVRTGFVAGFGAGRNGAEGRTDFIARFSMDPFRQSRWAPYAGAGLSGRYRSRLDGGSRAYLLVFLGVEGSPPLGAKVGWVPAVEVGLGGGARIGLVLRQGIFGRR